MDSEIGGDGVTQIGVAGALCREYLADERAFLGFLAASLQRAFGSDVELAYSGGFLSKKTLHSVTLTFGENRFVLEDPVRGPLQATTVHIVRGIALKTATMPVEEWLAVVAELAEQKVAQHAAARKALQDMLGLS